MKPIISPWITREMPEFNSIRLANDKALMAFCRLPGITGICALINDYGDRYSRGRCEWIVDNPGPHGTGYRYTYGRSLSFYVAKRQADQRIAALYKQVSMDQFRKLELIA